jgi:CCR4-NOT transcription complex subunit 1
MVSVLQSPEGWTKYAPLVCDYAATIGYLRGSFDHQVFQVCYKSFLRFLLVLIHDLPDFIAAVSLKILQFLPSDFIQIRNLVLSVVPKSIPCVPPLTPDLTIDHLSHQLACDMFPPLLPPAIEASIVKMVFGKGDLESLQVVLHCDLVLIPEVVSRAFILVCDQVHGQRHFNRLPIFVAFYSLLVKATTDVAVLYLESIIDQLRYPCRNSHFFARLLIELFKLNTNIADGVSLSEMITVALLRRAVLPPPHPWELQITIIELMSVSEIGFWDYPFVTANDNIASLLKAVMIVFCAPWTGKQGLHASVPNQSAHDCTCPT